MKQAVTPGWTPWQEFTTCVFPDLTMEDEVMLLELGQWPYLWWRASPYDQPQFDDGLMFYERPHDSG